jgi:hypothetical protein
MRTIICAFLLTAYIGADIAEARRSREHHSYRFYRDFYEEHKNKKERKPPSVTWGEATEALPYWGCDAITENGWGTRRIVKWVCIGSAE